MMKIILTALVTALITLQPMTAYGQYTGSQNVTVDNFPSTQAVTQSGTWSLGVNNFPSSFAVSNFPASQAITAASLPLPTGASTSANQSTGNASLSSIDSKLSGILGIQGASPSGTIDPTDKPVMISGINSSGAGGVKTIPNVAGVALDGSGNPINGMAVYDYAQGAALGTGDALTSGSGNHVHSNSKGSNVFIDVSGTWTGSLTVKVGIGSGLITMPIRSVDSGTQLSSITSSGTYVLENAYFDDVEIVNGVATGEADLYVLDRKSVV